MSDNDSPPSDQQQEKFTNAVSGGTNDRAGCLTGVGMLVVVVWLWTLISTTITASSYWHINFGAAWLWAASQSGVMELAIGTVAVFATYLLAVVIAPRSFGFPSVAGVIVGALVMAGSPPLTAAIPQTPQVGQMIECLETVETDEFYAARIRESAAVRAALDEDLIDAGIDPVDWESSPYADDYRIAAETLKEISQTQERAHYLKFSECLTNQDASWMCEQFDDSDTGDPQMVCGKRGSDSRYSFSDVFSALLQRDKPFQRVVEPYNG